jgi:hypothetical protein
LLKDERVARLAIALNLLLKLTEWVNLKLGVNSELVLVGDRQYL